MSLSTAKPDGTGLRLPAGHLAVLCGGQASDDLVSGKFRRPPHEPVPGTSFRSAAIQSRPSRPSYLQALLAHGTTGAKFSTDLSTTARSGKRTAGPYPRSAGGRLNVSSALRRRSSGLRMSPRTWASPSARIASETGGNADAAAQNGVDSLHRSGRMLQVHAPLVEVGRRKTPWRCS
jgi:hypothetical protein